MSSSQEFVDYVMEQFAPDLEATARKMFGEYGVFSGGKMFALICDDRLLFKPTDGGWSYVGEAFTQAPPYPGAKPCLLIQEQLDDPEWLSELARITVAELPLPKKKRKKKSK